MRDETKDSHKTTMKALQLLLVSVLLAFAFQASADPLLQAKAGDDAIDIASSISRLFEIALAAQLIVAALTMLFVVLHVALPIILLIGFVRKRYWHFGIRSCIIGLLIMYALIFYLIYRDRSQGDDAQQAQVVIESARGDDH